MPWSASAEQARRDVQEILQKSFGHDGIRLVATVDGDTAPGDDASESCVTHIKDYGWLALDCSGMNSEGWVPSGTEKKTILLQAALLVERGFLYERLARLKRESSKRVRQLRRSSQQFRFLYEHVPIPCQMIGVDGRILEVNSSWLSLFGYEAADVGERKFDTFLVEEYKTKFTRFLKRLFTGSGNISVELKVKRRDRSVVLTRLEGVALAGEFARPHVGFCLFLDVSGQSRLKELIFQSERFSTLAGIAAGMAHEINTPLSGILQSIQLIRMFLRPEDRENQKNAQSVGCDLEAVQAYMEKRDMTFFLEGIQSSAIKASDIINRLLEFSRPGSGQWERVELPVLMDTVISLARTDYDLKKKYGVWNVTFETEFDPQAPVVICMVGELERVLLTLIRNAVQALWKEGTVEPRITLRSRKISSGVQIEVEDNGPGIPQSVNPKAFDPFTTTRAPGEGVGLGLAVVFAVITEKLEGMIWIDTEYKDGARIIIELPEKDRLNEG